MARSRTFLMSIAGSASITRPAKARPGRATSNNHPVAPTSEGKTDRDFILDITHAEVLLQSCHPRRRHLREEESWLLLRSGIDTFLLPSRGQENHCLRTAPISS